MNLDIELTLVELKQVTQEIAPSTLNEHSTQEDNDNYHNCQKADQKTKYIILGFLDNVLQHHYVFMPITCDILVNPHELFYGKEISQASYS